MSYNTKQRAIILSFLKENKTSHLTADEITSALLNGGFRVGKTTVYRYLDKLVENGQARKFLPPDGKSSCYQYVEDKEICAEHFHFKCDGCGKLFHTECDMLSNINKHINAEHNFFIDSSKTVFYGSCEKCLKQKERPLK